MEAAQEEVAVLERKEQMHSNYFKHTRSPKNQVEPKFQDEKFDYQDGNHKALSSQTQRDLEEKNLPSLIAVVDAVVFCIHQPDNIN